MDTTGYILLAKKLIESDIWGKPPEWLKVWIYILMSVNYKDTAEFKRGSNFYNWQITSFHLRGITQWQWVNSVRWLKRAKQITTRKTTRGMIITVVNYGQYQARENYRATQKTEQKTESKQNRSNTIKERSKEVNILSPKVAKGFVDIESLLNAKQKHLQLIGFYLKATKKKFDTPEELTVTVKRWMKVASDVAKFDEAKINKAFEIAKDKYPDFWDLGTVFKILTK